MSIFSTKDLKGKNHYCTTLDLKIFVMCFRRSYHHLGKGEIKILPYTSSYTVVQYSIPPVKNVKIFSLKVLPNSLRQRQSRSHSFLRWFPLIASLCEPPGQALFLVKRDCSPWGLMDMHVPVGVLHWGVRVTTPSIQCQGRVKLVKVVTSESSRCTHWPYEKVTLRLQRTYC